MNYKEGFKKHGIPFFIYLILSSSLLFNHDGGADMAFMFVMIFFLVIHFILILIMISLKKWGDMDLIPFFVIGFIFFISSNLYLVVMWQFTTWIKNNISN